MDTLWLPITVALYGWLAIYVISHGGIKRVFDTLRNLVYALIYGRAAPLPIVAPPPRVCGCSVPDPQPVLVHDHGEPETVGYLCGTCRESVTPEGLDRRSLADRRARERVPVTPKAPVCDHPDRVEIMAYGSATAVGTFCSTCSP